MLLHGSRQVASWLIFDVRQKMNLACPCCGFRTIAHPYYGSYEFCPVCDWEDDAVQLANPCSGGGANQESLFVCQKAVATWSKEEMALFERDPDWRPLVEEEVIYFQAQAQRQHWTFMGDTAPELAYWRRSLKTKATNQPPEPTR